MINFWKKNFYIFNLRQIKIFLSCTFALIQIIFLAKNNIEIDANLAINETSRTKDNSTIDYYKTKFDETTINLLSAKSVDGIYNILINSPFFIHLKLQSFPSINPQKKETKSSVSVTEIADTNNEMESIKTTQPNPNNVVTEKADNNDYSIGLLLTDWNTPISDIPEVDLSLNRVCAVDNTTNHFHCI